MATLAINRRAHYDYSISQKYEAGLVLSGNEVKSIKTGHISLKESFVTIKGNELYLTNANIPFYHLGGKMKDYDPTRPRKLLLKKSVKMKSRRKYSLMMRSNFFNLKTIVLLCKIFSLWIKTVYKLF